MKMLILVNITKLADTYPEDVLNIQKAVETFARRYNADILDIDEVCLLYTSPSPRDRTRSRMPSSA